ncbi:ABC transporter permease [Homoserinibacter sp. GY 40078]|uniref:ABC transporter permease n=1 Tax=Homoserinibacter sp. GY 40078 TaxID=2603275 RepID=UPI002106FF58|nr:ABC transporter permease [Homoserinibacter sp. GY 40078]
MRRPGVVVPAAILLVLLIISAFPAFFAGLFGNGDPRVCDLTRSIDGPEAGHPFGFDVQGCDVYANVIFGTQSSITVGVLTTGLALLVAVALGVIAGTRGGWADMVISRLTDVFLGFPFLLGAIIALNSVAERNVWSVSIVLALFSWPTLARLVRSSVRGVANSEYVLAARTMGLSSARVIGRYILPNAMGAVIVVSTIMIGSVIVAESTLTYLGIGLEAPAISWGLQLASAQSKFQMAPHLLIFPSLFLAVTVFCVIVLGDSLRAAFDPRRTA